MFALAHALTETGRSVLTTTSTKIMYRGRKNRIAWSSAPTFPRWFRGSRTNSSAAGTLPSRSSAVAPAADGDTVKLRGFSANELEVLVDSRVAEHVIIEADGSAGRSLKAHLDHEPVVSARADLVIAVIGAIASASP